MRKNLLYILSSIGLLAAIILGAFSLLYNSADAAPPQAVIFSNELIYQEEETLPSPVISYQANSKVDDSAIEPAVDLPNVTEEKEVVIETDYEVLATVESLTRRYAQSLLVDAPSWIMIRAERFLPDSNVPMANGAQLPDRYIEETWINVNAEGQVIESLNRSLADNGDLLRQNYVNDVQEVESGTEPALNSITLDYGALVRIRIGLEYGSEVKGWSESGDGVEKYIVTLTDYYDAPIQFAGQQERTSSLQVRLVFDMKSGQLLNMDIVHQYETGKTAIIGGVKVQDIQTMSAVLLPVDIQQALPLN